MLRFCRALALAVSLVAGCTGGPQPDPPGLGDRDAGGGLADAGRPRDSGAAADSAPPAVPCTSNPDCDDDLYCNGVERCGAPGDPGAREDGCVPGDAVTCDDGEGCTIDLCDEETRSCVSSAADLDADGHGEFGCSTGDDCDDDDGLRFPGAAEVCDADGLDEDCNLDTMGPDADDDGAVQAGCCQRLGDGTLVCGGDCNDGNPDIRPSAPESCNGVDDDCDGMTDEELLSVYYVDVDGDSYGDDTMSMSLCAPMEMYRATRGGDCDDADPMIHPGAPEVGTDCTDTDCDGTLLPAEDADRDGLGASSCGGPDCNDADATHGLDCMCAPDPAPPGGSGCPAVCNGGCAEGACRIACTDATPCSDVTCPADWACSVRCEGTDSCPFATIRCASTYACDITCRGTDACGVANIHCGSASSCEVDCQLDGCTGSTVHCASTACTAHCEPGGPPPTLTECDTACSCRGC